MQNMTEKIVNSLVQIKLKNAIIVVIDNNRN